MKLRSGNRITPPAYPIITQRNADAPLLKLPAEIKDRIYKLVLDDSTIHIVQRPDKLDDEFRPVYCNASMSQGQASNHYKNTSKDLSLRFLRRHDDCTQYCTSVKYYGGMLLSCRQVYNDASYIFWAATTFIFHGPGTLCDFLERGVLHGSSCITMITRIELSMKIHCEAQENFWDRAIRRMSEILTNLQSIHLVFENFRSKCNSLRYWPLFDISKKNKKGAPLENAPLAGIESLKSLPLWSLTVMAYTSEYLPRGWNAKQTTPEITGGWKDQSKELWSNYMTEWILTRE